MGVVSSPVAEPSALPESHQSSRSATHLQEEGGGAGLTVLSVGCMDLRGGREEGGREGRGGREGGREGGERREGGREGGRGWREGGREG